MPDISKILPAQRILPALQDQHVMQKKNDGNQDKKKRKSEPEKDQERKVDEYI